VDDGAADAGVLLVVDDEHTRVADRASPFRCVVLGAVVDDDDVVDEVRHRRDGLTDEPALVVRGNHRGDDQSLVHGQPAVAESRSSRQILSAARPSSPDTFGGVRFTTQSAKCAISCMSGSPYWDRYGISTR